MLPHCSHITRKRGIYYYRRRLPWPRRGEVAVSLGNARYREAEHLAQLLDQTFRRVVLIMKQASDHALQAALREYLREAIEADRENFESTPYGKPVYVKEADLEPHQDAYHADLELLEHLLWDAREALGQRDFDSVAHTVDELLVKHDLPQGSRRALTLGVLKADIEIAKRSLDRLRGYSEDRHEPFVRSTPPSGPKLSVVLPGFVEFMVVEEGWRAQTRAQNDATYRLLLEWCGDKGIQAYTRRDLDGFYEMLRKLPALYSKDRRWRGRALRDVLEETQQLEVARLSMKTIKRHFSALGRLFGYAKTRGLYEGENPAHGFDFPTKGRKGNPRRPWEGELLTRLFQSPVWTGCHPRFRSRPGTEIVRDERFWLPILGLYHGNRLEEFAQLRREDVCLESGIWYFDITDGDGRQLKNEQSKRRVPLHPEVLRIGFLDHLGQTATAPSDRVFPLLQPGGPDRKLSYYFTKWWSQYRKDVGVYEKGLDYHSFRHGVTTKLFSAGVDRVLVDELTGHEGEGVSQRIYHHGSPLERLAEAITKVSWAEVQLTHLYSTRTGH